MKDEGAYKKDGFELLGGVEGVRALANSFYDIMEKMPEARVIRDMHPENLEPTRENLTLFICGWLGGPALYKEKHGSVNLTEIHAFFDIDIAKRDIWLLCMERALDLQPIEREEKEYLLHRFRVPAGKICSYCQQRSQRKVIF